MSLIQKLVQQDDLLTHALIDPVTKFRVSTPESMIQTDFEYGLQPTKWESIELVNNIPVFYVKDGDLDIPLVSVKTSENSFLVLVQSSIPHNFVAGSPFVITGLKSITAEGTYIVYSIVNEYEFYYRAKQSQLLDADVLDSYTTYMYSARIFSATQYNMDNLIAVETSGITDRETTAGQTISEPESSTIKVITQFPHGFVEKSTFMMGNSIGQKNVDFNAKLIDVNGLITQSLTINTASNNPSGSGYLSRVVNPYEFQSKQTYFVDLANINYTGNYITMSNHGLVTGNFLMYVSPVNDLPVSGLENYRLYYVNVLSPHQVSVSNVEPYLYDGLDYKRYNTTYATTQLTPPSSLSAYEFTNTLATLQDWTGNHATSLRVGSISYPNLRFSEGTTLFGITEPASPNLGIIGTTSYSTTAFAWNNTTYARNAIFDIEGYFYTPYTGEHRFKIISNHLAYLWTGSNATTYEFNPTKKYSYTPTSRDATQTLTRTWGNGYTLTSNELIINLTSNQLLPIRARFINRPITAVNPTFELSYKFPYFNNRTNTCLRGCNVGSFVGIGTTHMDYALDGKSFFFSTGRYESSVGIGTTMLGNVNTEHKSYYRFTPITLSDGVGSQKYGIHSFHKAYLVNGYVQKPRGQNPYSTGYLNVNYNPNANDGQGAAAASLSKGGRVAVFSGDVITKREGLGIPQIPPTLNNFGGYSSNLHYNLSGELIPGSATVSFAVTAVSSSKTAASDNFYPTSDVLLSKKSEYFAGYKLSSVNWVVPVSDVAFKDSFYSPSHGFRTNDVILFATGAWGSLPTGLVANKTYYADVPDVNYLRVKEKAGVGANVNINAFTEASFTITRTTSNVYVKDQRLGAYRIYAEGHDYTSNTPVFYYPGTTPLTGISKNNLYYVSKPYSDSFQLAATVNGNPLRITHTITSDEYHSIRSADRGTTDGNFIIDESTGINVQDPYMMQFVTKNPLTGLPTFGIPYNRRYFHPRKALDLNSNLFYLPDHRLRTGSRVIYGTSNDGAGGPIGNLTVGNSYFTIRIDDNRFRLSTIDAGALVGTGITSGPFIDAWTQINANPTSGYIVFNQTFGVYPNDRNDGSSYHYFDIASIGGDTPFPKPLRLENNCNLIRNAVDNQGVDFTSVAKLGGTIGIRYTDRSNIYPLVGVGTTAGATEIIVTGNPNNFVNGDAIVYSAPIGRRGIAGLSNEFVYYVGSVSGIGSTQTRISYIYNTSNDAVQDNQSAAYTGLGNYTGFNTSLSGFFTKKFAGQIDYYTITDINSKNVVTAERDIVLPSWLTSPNSNAGQIMLSTGIYPRLDSYIEHRAYNGGVEIVPSLCPYTKITRQTRKYFRYQAGKGIQLSKAINFSAPIKFSILKLETDETSVYYNMLIGKTRSPHRLTAGLSITIQNAISSGSTDYWNGVYNVDSVSLTDPTIFYINPKFDPTVVKISPTYAGGFPEFVVNGWNKDSSYLRVGMFDDQNGIFFEYDGVDLNAVRRNSIQQLTGTARVEYNSSLVTGTNTAFNTSRPYLDVGSMIVIRGVSYRVVYILNDQYMYIQPPYRGVTADNVVISLTVDSKTPSSQWSIDKCDGTGPSGFVFNIHKIQMMYIDFSWYGAGKVRYGFKGVNGDVVYVHELIHNNIFTEAYMRAGNLPGRYEVGNGASPIFAPALQHWGTSIIMDGRQDTDKEYLFTAGGKQINYFNKDTTDFGISTVANTATNTFKLAYNISYLGASNTPTSTFISATPVLYDPTRNTDVQAYTVWFGTSADTATGGSTSLFAQLKLYGPGTDVTQLTGTTKFFAPGTKFVAYPELVDGIYYMYLDKKPLATTLTPVSSFRLGTGTDSIPSIIPLVSIRLAPSVDNGRPALLGQREVVNRMQIELDSASVMVSHDCEIQLILNGNPFYKNYSRLPTPSLTQAIFHEKYDSIQGGLSIYTIRAAGGTADANGKRNTVITSVELKNVATLGNSIIGGNGTYPDGPDILTIVAKPLDINNVGVFRPLSVSARVSWKEAQA